MFQYTGIVTLSFVLTLQGIHVAMGKNSYRCANVAFNVTLGVNFKAVQELDFDKQLIKLQLGFSIVWKEPFLVMPPLFATSNSSADRNMSNGLPAYRFLKPRDLCIPSLHIDESTSDIEILNNLPSNTDIMVQPDGTCTLYQKLLHVGWCPMDARDFPFDVQTCKLTWWTSIKPDNYLDLTPLLPKFVAQDKNEWEILNVTVTKTNYVSTFFTLNGLAYGTAVYSVVMRRAPMFYILNWALPGAIAAVVAVVAIFSPGQKLQLNDHWQNTGGKLTSRSTQESNRHLLLQQLTPPQQNRCQIGLMALLYCSVQLLSISEKMPVTVMTNGGVPIISKFYSVLFLVIALSTIIHALMLSWTPATQTLDPQKMHPLRHSGSNSNPTVVHEDVISAEHDGQERHRLQACTKAICSLPRSISIWVYKAALSLGTRMFNWMMMLIFLSIITADVVWFFSFSHHH